MHKWNKTKESYPADKTIQKLFEEQVERTPDSIALVFEDQQITYRELNKRANQLAHYVKDSYEARFNQALEPDTLIAICIDRSLEMVIAILAVLKAGAAYVPLDSNYPTERLQHILNDTRAPLLLTQSSLLSQLPSYDGQIICLDDEQEIFAQGNFSNLDVKTQDNNLAYVIYTSGTTGTPKGVMITQKAVVSRIYYLINKHGINSLFNIAAKIPYIFDPSIREIFLSLLCGARLIIFSEEVNKNTDKLISYSISFNIDLLIFVPSHLQIVITHLKSLSKQKLRMFRLKILYCCGEVLPKNLVTEIKNYLPNLIIKNQYGPTEGCLFSFEFDLYETTILDSSIPVGKLVDNMKGYVLDPNLIPLPVGEIGEIYIAGDGLARGYLNHPTLTAEKFIPNPFQNPLERQQNINNKLYKTGDLARWLPDKNLEYIGRNDFQVKIRGYRIELTEIEQVILTYPGIIQVVVIAHELHPLTKWLVAYFVIKNKDNEITEKLREHLIPKLPEYMIPNIFMSLDEFPITRNGKLDRKALPLPKIISPDKNYIPPSTPIEQQLVNIWAKVLMLDKEAIGINNNFFQLGGDSFTAMQMISQTRLKGINIKLKDIKNYPTIAELSINLQHDNFVSSSQIDIIDENEYILPLLPFHRNLPFSPLINTKLVKLKNGSLDPNRLEDALQKLISRHSALRTKIIWENGKWLQKVHPYCFKPLLRHVNFHTKPNENLDSVITLHLKNLVQEIEEKFVSFEGMFFEWQKETYFLCVLSHHHFDVMSQMIFWQELDIAYQNEPLPPSELSYSEAVSNLHELAERDRKKELLFWEKQLQNIKPLNLLANIFKEKKNKNLNIISKANWQRMESKLDEILLPFITPKASQISIHDLLLTAWVQALCIHFKLQEVVINIVMHGRGTEEDEIGNIGGVIGCFVSHYPIKFTFPVNTGKSAVQHIRNLIDQAPHKGMRYGLLRYGRPDLQNFWEKLPISYLFFHFQIATKEEEQSGIWQTIKEQHFNELLMQGRLEPLWILNPKTDKLSCSMLFGQCYSPEDIEKLWQQYTKQIQQLAKASSTDHIINQRDIYEQFHQ